MPGLIKLTFDKLLRFAQMCDLYHNLVLFKVVNIKGTNRIHIFVFKAFTLLLKGVVANYIQGKTNFSIVTFCVFHPIHF